MGTTEVLAAYPRQSVEVYESNWDDVNYLADRLREADRQEIQAATGKAPWEALANGLKISDRCITVTLEDSPILMAGVVPARLEGVAYGSVWLLGSPGILKIHRLFLREGKRWLKYLEDDYELVGNLVDARNTVHHRWIKWMGFSFLRRVEEFGVERRPFLEFLKIV